MDVFEAMDTARAMRYLKPDPVPGQPDKRFVGYPERPFGPVRRKPINEISHSDTFSGGDA